MAATIATAPSTAAAITRTEGPVICTGISRSPLGFLQATLVQEIADNRTQEDNGLFTAAQLGGATRKRTCFIGIPEKDADGNLLNLGVDDINAMISPKARIKYIYSYAPVLEGKEGAKTAERQIRRGKDGKVLLHAGKQYYMREKFSNAGEADEDRRTVVVSVVPADADKLF